jgi:hypothetical protein
MALYIIKSVPVNASETVSGRYVDVVNPDPRTIVISDIAWSLSRQARFAGHTSSEEIWSVAQHSLFVEFLVQFALSADDAVSMHHSLNTWLVQHDQRALTNENRLKFRTTRLLLGALLHDSAEAYLVDVPSPVKRANGIRAPYQALENKMQIAIEQSLQLCPLTPTDNEIIKWADLYALKIEAMNLMSSRGAGWAGLPEVNSSHVDLFPEIMPWAKVCVAFMDRFNSLMAEM